MIIDADTHISPTRESGNSLLVEELIERMDAAGVEKALTWIQPPYIRSRLDDSLRYLYDSTRRFPERLIGFGWVDPNLGLQNGFDTIKRCVEEYGFHGVKLNGAQNTFYLDDEAVSLPLVEAVVRLGKPVAFHCGADVRDYTHPSLIATVAKRFPEAKFIMVHMGGASFDDFSRAAIAAAKECPNITLIGSAIRTIPLLRAIRELGSERIAFGSDTPFELMYLEVAKYRAFIDAELSPEDGENLMWRTIATVLDV
ncbi:MAG: amidohydrolase family protein [Planctomycetaceae bacterium]|nr:amidohydrolase family protein [Planctomycetaceae bacterium]